jgi:hypothetical protein
MVAGATSLSTASEALCSHSGIYLNRLAQVSGIGFSVLGDLAFTWAE